MGRPSKNQNTNLTQPDMLSPLRHIELAIQREYELLTKYERTKVGHLFHLAREELRDASDTLAGIRENRNKRTVKVELG